MEWAASSALWPVAAWRGLVAYHQEAAPEPAHPLQSEVVKVAPTELLTTTMGASKWNSSTISDLIIEVWEALDCESVGKAELEEIQKVLDDKFGPGGVSSPATIARTLADEGAVLRHPEIFECDYNWRLQKLSEHDAAGQLGFANLSEAIAAFDRVEEQRQAAGDDPKELKRLRDIVASARADVLLASQSKVLSHREREEAVEALEWISVWLRSPQLFPDWLDLRMRTAEFKGKFRT